MKVYVLTTSDNEFGDDAVVDSVYVSKRKALAKMKKFHEREFAAWVDEREVIE